ncbi:Bifunctional hemolysin/adenylate cyclase [Pseudomonas sp. Bi123]|uniref:beta strand repeat-containing protein n=1 Tax=Pseudomonas sp. Bi123 TaxID=2821121 RepID=UPI001DFBE533|nr:calcium-binding protein [Pseudomonas sp. Bi123]CAH0277916.1 Bifunctional hemolysin/adenylate cyclase [Pseudomonas sp. Bi123]
MAVINGTSGTDTLIGTSVADELYGFAGNDSLDGGAGNDLLDGGAGADVLNGGAGTDTVSYVNSTSAVNVDLLTGKGTGGDAQGDTYLGIERVVGSAFNDTLTGYNPIHILEGGAGNDVYVITNQGATVVEQAGGGDDEMRTQLNTQVLATNVERLTFVGTGNFIGTGNASDNIITGGAGNDTLRGGGGADQFIGGAGTDTVSYSDSNNQPVTINTKTGINLGLAADDTYVGIEILQGGGGNDTFISGAAVDTFDGSGGTDTVDYSGSSSAVDVNFLTAKGTGGDAQGDTYLGIERVVGSAFNDTLTGYNPIHILEGGAGNDVYVISNQGATVVEQAGGGDDEMRTQLNTQVLATNVERLTFVGTGNFIGTGNASDNIITGGAGNDTLRGGGGADQFIGGAGTDTVSYSDSGNQPVTINTKTGINLGLAADDTYVGIEILQGGGGNDTFISGAAVDTFDGSGGTDTVDYSGSSSAVDVNFLTGKGTGGDAQGDTYLGIERVVGSAFNDTLTGYNPIHILEGGAGDDVYVISNQGATVVEQAGGGDDEVRTQLNTQVLANNVERLTFVGTGNFIGTGNASDNIITGGAGNDTLRGGDGADQFIGGAGTDTVSYSDSASGLTINLKTGIHTSIAAGDTYNSIEQISGSNFSDIFIGGDGADRIDGGAGTDFLSFANEGSGVTLDLSVPVLTGIAAGDVYTSIEAFLGSNYDDTFTGSAGAVESFVGGGGADVLTGVGRGDAAWYVNSSDAVQVNLLTGTGTGGDAQGDVLSNIDNLVGSTFNDTLTGNAYANMLEGGAGNDTLYGGDGNDILYGDSFTVTGALAVTSSSADQADTIYGGNGDDYIIGHNHDVGSVFYGEAGNDNITVLSGIADGGDGNDTLMGLSRGYELRGGAGADKLYLSASGDGYGGEGSDAYFVSSKTMVAIFDDGTTGVDTVTLKNIQSLSDVRVVKNDLGAYIFNAADLSSGNLDSGVFLKDWYAGANTIETFITNNGDSFTIPV